MKDGGVSTVGPVNSRRTPFSFSSLGRIQSIGALLLALAVGSHAQEALDPVKLRQFKTQASSGDLDTQYYLGFIYAAGQGVEKNPIEAVLWFTMAAEKGKKEAQEYLAYAYYRGEGAVIDPKKAIEWWKKAANQGSVTSEEYLG